MTRINMQRDNAAMQVLEKNMAMEKWFDTDSRFNRLYPAAIQRLSGRHWTPLLVARMAGAFLAMENNKRILDIGSGVGKFCLAAAAHFPDCTYFGIEQRLDLLRHAEAARQQLGIANISFIHGNFTQLNLRNYDHFYFYNSFYENLQGTEKIDASIDYSEELYYYYSRYLLKELEKMPAGTRLATFHSMDDEVPAGFHIVGSAMDHLLKFWIKI